MEVNDWILKIKKKKNLMFNKFKVSNLESNILK